MCPVNSPADSTELVQIDQINRLLGDPHSPTVRATHLGLAGLEVPLPLPQPRGAAGPAVVELSPRAVLDRVRMDGPSGAHPVVGLFCLSRADVLVRHQPGLAVPLTPEALRLLSLHLGLDHTWDAD